MIRCSNVAPNLFEYLEQCRPVLNDSQLTSHSNINVIGYVERPPETFDMLINPSFTTQTPLMKLNSVHGKVPANILQIGTFMNCTGKVRLIRSNQIYIDTPSTYGFSGGPCFITSATNGWNFHGIMTGASRLWNVCISLTNSKAFHKYFNDRMNTDNEKIQNDL
mgnify:CR=1 FL=1